MRGPQRKNAVERKTPDLQHLFPQKKRKSAKFLITGSLKKKRGPIPQNIVGVVGGGKKKRRQRKSDPILRKEKGSQYADRAQPRNGDTPTWLRMSGLSGEKREKETNELVGAPAKQQLGQRGGRTPTGWPRRSRGGKKKQPGRGCRPSVGNYLEGAQRL